MGSSLLPHCLSLQSASAFATGPDAALAMSLCSALVELLLCVGSPWLTPTHPDPKGAWLSLLAIVLRGWCFAKPHEMPKPRYGILWECDQQQRHERCGLVVRCFRE